MDAPNTTSNACAGLTDTRRARLIETPAILLDARGIVIRISEWLGGRRSNTVSARHLQASAGMPDHVPPSDRGQEWSGRRNKGRSMPAT